MTEKSCGAIVYTRERGNIEYVIIRSKEGIYGFPKGHTEDYESEKETALREVAEEVGLTVTLIPEFRLEDMHTFSRNGETIQKHIVYFLGEYSAQTPSVQESELSDVSLMNYKTAMSSFQFESSRRLLAEANNFLIKLQTR